MRNRSCCLSSRKALRSSYCFSITSATSLLYPLSLHDALPIYANFFPGMPRREPGALIRYKEQVAGAVYPARTDLTDRKSTRLNSSHANISYAVFCLKKKKRHYAQHTDER